MEITIYGWSTRLIMSDSMNSLAAALGPTGPTTFLVEDTTPTHPASTTPSARRPTTTSRKRRAVTRSATRRHQQLGRYMLLPSHPIAESHGRRR